MWELRRRLGEGVRIPFARWEEEGVFNGLAVGDGGDVEADEEEVGGTGSSPLAGPEDPSRWGARTEDLHVLHGRHRCQ